MKLSSKKGHYGYRTSHKRRRLMIVLLFLAAIAAQLIFRSFISQKGYKNLITVSAILTVLPMANLASPLLAAWKIPEISKAFYEACHPYEEKFPILYDLIITSKETILRVDATAVHPHGVYLFCPDKSVDKKKAETYINQMLIKWKLDGNARIIQEEKTFLRRLSELKPVTEEEDDGSAAYVTKLLTDISM